MTDATTDETGGGQNGTGESGHCPKCAAKHGGGSEACARCGLIFANWTPDAAAAQPRLDEQGRTLWEELQANWTDKERHDKFLKYCSAGGTLGPAGRAYRERVLRDPQDVVAIEMQEKILGMASAMLAPTAKPDQQSPVLHSKVFWGILVLAAVVGMMAGVVFKGC